MIGRALISGCSSFLSIGFVLAGIAVNAPSFADGATIESGLKGAYTPWCAKHGSLCVSQAGDPAMANGSFRHFETAYRTAAAIGATSAARISVARSDRR
jgi:hypothetical protein